MVYLIGAGPGDIGLITCRGRELLENCDAVIYDRLGTEQVMEYVNDSCEKIYVGKQAGSHYKTQDEINKLLIETAEKYRKVVRLKGGDSFVFGRGGEEILELKKHGVEFEVIPGITSAIAVPELAGIPVTHRIDSRSFQVFTGHTAAEGKSNHTEHNIEHQENQKAEQLKKQEEIQQELSHIHRVDGTGIILMGLANIGRIMDKLVLEGESKETPVAVISKGTMLGEKIVRGNVGNIQEKVIQSDIQPPAIIVVGKTAAYEFVSEKFGLENRKNIGVVGTKIFRDKLRKRFEENGDRIFTLCDMKIQEDEIDVLSEELAEIEKYDWICFTSQNAISLFFEAAGKESIDYRRFANIRIAVVGSGTKEALRKEGFIADFMPEKYTTEELAIGLKNIVHEGDRILILRAREGSHKMTDILESAHVEIKDIPLYHLEGRPTDNFNHLDDFDGLVFGSASGVRCFVENLRYYIKTQMVEIEEWEKNRKARGMKIGAIGHVTANELAKFGIEADVVPECYDVEHFCMAMRRLECEV